MTVLYFSQSHILTPQPVAFGRESRERKGRRKKKGAGTILIIYPSLLFVTFLFNY